MNDPTQGFIDFQRLPYDIHALILSFLHPEDIIAIRKTCRTMFDATIQRDLWMKAVMRMCEENTTHRSSFPIADMGLLDLEYASMGVSRWKKLVSNTGTAGKGPLSAFRVRTIRTDILPAQLYLIPGGRFLLMLYAGSLLMWDLLDLPEASDLADMDRQPMATIDSIQCNSFTAHPTPDGSGIIIITVTYISFPAGDTDIRQSYEVFKIFPGQPNAQLVSVARISISSQYYLDFTSVVGNRLVLLYGPLVKIWDFVTNAWASWNAGDHSSQILMDENTIALIRERKVCIWDFPELSTTRDAHEEFKKVPESGQSTHVPPRAVITFPEEYNTVPENILGCGGLCDWYTGSRQPLMFDLWEKSPRASHFEFTRFHVDSQHPESGLKITSAAPAQLALRNANARPSCTPYHACGEDTVVAWSDNDNIFCHTGGISSYSGVNSVTTLLNIKDVTGREFSLCPIAGRLCYVDADTCEVRVLDFFPLPPKQP